MMRWLIAATLLAAHVCSTPSAALAQVSGATIFPTQTAGVISQDPGDGTPPFGSTYLPFGNYISTLTQSSIFARSYLQFSLGAIPPGVSITSAYLEVDADLFSSAGSGTFGVYNVISTWDESMLWNTRASIDTTPWSSTTIASTPGVHSFDVTALVQAWLNGTSNNGMMLGAIPPIDSGVLSAPGFAVRGLGRTSGSPPRLIVNWTTGLAPKPKGGTIRGTVFVDQDHDGVFDADESGLPGVTVHVASNGAWSVDLISGADGTYAPVALSPANYGVSMDVPPGYTATTATQHESITINANAVTGQDFGVAPHTTSDVSTSIPILLPQTGVWVVGVPVVAVLSLSSGLMLIWIGMRARRRTKKEK